MMDTEIVSSVEIPEGFNRELGVPSRVEDTGVFHSTVMAARFAYDLAKNGAPEDLEILERAIDTLTQKCQELNPDDPHFGNFCWELEDAGVEDLNAVHFAMIQMIPIMLRFGDRLSETSREQILKSTRLALAEIEWIDVGLDYTNIVLKDIINTILGGEMLEDEHYVQRGKQKLKDWLEFTYVSGGVTEINSPVYTNLVLEVMVLLSDLSKDPEVATLGRLISARMGLVYALRVHLKTGRLAGPFSRSYRPHLLGEVGPELDFINRSISNGELPGWIKKVLGTLPMPGDLLEGYDEEKELFYASHMSDSFSMGVATRELITQENRYIAGQSNVFTMNFKTPEDAMGGLVFTRYTMDENWLGDFRSTPARTSKGLLLDEGRFFGVANGNRAIGVYSPKFMGSWETRSAAKMVIIISNKEYLREVMVNGEAVESFPHDVPEKALVSFGFEESLLAIRLFDRTDLGVDAPLRLIERDGELLLEVYNYKGSEKTFWELAYPGSFYKGQPKCAFYAESAERSDYSSLKDFSEQVATGEFSDQSDAEPGRFTRDQIRAWNLGYARDEKSVGLSVDLLQWQLLRRWNENGDLDYPLLESSVASQSEGGTIQVDGARLHCGNAKLWLYGSRESDLWVLGGIADKASDLTLEFPDRSLQVNRFRYGIIKVEAGQVVLDANPEATAEFALPQSRWVTEN